MLEISDTALDAAYCAACESLKLLDSEAADGSGAGTRGCR
jgi:hypothetical protein